MRDRIRQVVADVFQLPLSDVPADASNATLPGWDSLRHMELMLAVELEFGTQISSEAMPTLLSIEDIELYLREQGVATAA